MVNGIFLLLILLLRAWQLDSSALGRRPLASSVHGGSRTGMMGSPSFCHQLTEINEIRMGGGWMQLGGTGIRMRGTGLAVETLGNKNSRGSDFGNYKRMTSKMKVFSRLMLQQKLQNHREITVGKTFRTNRWRV